MPVKNLVLIIVALAIGGNSFGQVVRYGFKAGLNGSWVRLDDEAFRDQVNIKPVPGFNAGFVFSFKMKDRYFLRTEVLYTTKGKETTGDLNLDDKVTYNYIEVPLIYNIHFNGRLRMKSVKHFQWYAGIGPNFSYWLGGKGTISHFEFEDAGAPPMKYKIRFGERNNDDPQLIFYNDVKRLQLGVNIGGGILLEPANNRKIMVDFRFELGHTWLGTSESADYIFPVTYDDNLKARNMGLRVSVMYLFESNLDKKVRNRGKSTIKHRR